MWYDDKSVSASHTLTLYDKDCSVAKPPYILWNAEEPYLYTAVIMWSLGNESNYGDNTAEMSARIRELDTKMGFHRLIHYEGTYCLDKDLADPDTVDLVSRMYYTPKDMIDYIERTGD